MIQQVKIAAHMRSNNFFFSLLTNTPIPCHSVFSLWPSSPFRNPTMIFQSDEKRAKGQSNDSTHRRRFNHANVSNFTRTRRRFFSFFFPRADKTERRRNISNRAKVFFLNSIGRLLLVSLRCRKKRDLSTWFKSSRNSFKRDPHRRRLMAFLFLKNRQRIEGSQVDR